jgi:transcription elongation factor GreA
MSVSFLTQEGYDELQNELDYLRNVKRKEVAQRLHEAMEGGELIENAEYEAAKNEQAFTEGRIKELEYLLATARIVTEAQKADTIQVGSKVTIVEEGLDEEELYTIVGAAEAKPSIGKISNESPLGKALLNHKVGDIVSVNAPAGAYKVKIIKFE